MKYKFETKAIGDCCDITKKSIHPEKGQVYTCFSLPAFDNSNTPEILNGEEIKSSKYVLDENTILFNKLNPKFRRVWNIHSLEKYENTICSTEFLPLKAKANIEQDYLYYYVSSPYFTRLMDGIRTGTSNSQQRIDWKQFLREPINVPSLPIQRKVVSLLRNIDKKIELNNAINNNSLQQLDTLYDEFSHRKNWSTVIINDIAEKVAMGPFGSNIKVSTFVSEGVPIISGNHLRGYFLEEPSFNYITEEHAQRLKNSLVYPKDIVFTHAGNIGQVAMIPDDCRYPMYVLSQRQFYLRCDTEKAIPEYVVLFFHSKQGQHELLSYANQTGVPSIAQPATNLKKIPLKLPPIDEQRQWLQVVSPIIKLYQSNVYENEHLSSMRDSLLPKLMSGELDVSDIDL